MFLKNRNISSKIKRSKVTDYAALTASFSDFQNLYEKILDVQQNRFLLAFLMFHTVFSLIRHAS